ncbi:hypothetical protein [Nostoc sp. FACHB-110]|uniref:hypothetical protein n=1 Tax=Nostoc sp. FACHB-110 TaxID=2692834 RepID=UPI0016877D4D|nr:hypothetical protein [Nostoc sp. FACHB-110]MBD2438786.1 hypothetical protein [Nostoc sp. FACHB-110]
MRFRHFIGVFLGLFLIFAMPELIQADAAIADIDIQPEITQLTKLIKLTIEKVDLIDKETNCRIHKNASLEIEIGEQKTKKDDIESKINYLKQTIGSYTNKLQELESRKSEAQSKYDKARAEYDRIPAELMFNNPWWANHTYELSQEVGRYSSEISQIKKELDDKKNRLAQEESQYKPISEEFEKLKITYSDLESQIKLGKKILSELNFFHKKLKEANDHNKEQLRESQKSKSKIEKLNIEQLNKEAQNILEIVDNFLLKKSCLG